MIHLLETRIVNDSQKYLNATYIIKLFNINILLDHL